ncbi:MAG: hypothetical protein KAJ08_01815, partial [Deltaproteobacteria bacterium]|nr:hypothetical protein [Deltaproteobacteria bacterium]
MTENMHDAGVSKKMPSSSGSNRGEGNSKSKTSRRSFLKLGVAGAGVAAAGAYGITVARRMEGIPQDTLPIPINDDFKPIDQRNVLHIFAYSKALDQKHPERTKKFGNYNFYERFKT